MQTHLNVTMQKPVDWT